MVQLYKETNTDYEHNGDVTFDPIACSVDMVLNGAWEMTLEVPLDSLGKFKEIKRGAVIMAPTPIGDKQLYRIYETDKSIASVVAYARPIFLDAADEVYFADIRPTNMTAQDALDYLLKDTKYTATTDIKLVKTAYYIRKNFIEALASDEDNSFLSRWGGEILYDNYSVDVSTRQGQDRGLRVEFGRNINEIQETINDEAMATRIQPVAFNGYTLDGDEPWIDSPLIDNYAKIYAKAVSFDNIRMAEDVEDDSDAVGYDTLEELQQALVDAVNELYANGYDLPSVTYEIDMVDLRGTDAYKGFESLEDIALGDTVHCYHRELDIETAARAIEIVYDCITRTVTEITLGDYQEDYFSRVSSAVSSSSSSVNFSSLMTEIAYIKSNYIQTNQIDALIGNFGYLTADEADIRYATIIELDAAKIEVNELLADYIKAEQIDAILGNFGFLTADSALIQSLVADIANINDLMAGYATVEDLAAFMAEIGELVAGYATIDYLEANYATIYDLNAVYADVGILDADVANIITVLSGSVGTGDLQAIHITSGNVIIDDAVITNAMIASISADKLTSGTIYTNYVRIQTAEDDTSLWIDGSLIQMSDENSTVRVQLGQDASGNYNFYIWNADGELMFDALGVTAEGIGYEVIVNDHIAEGANINESKLDMQSIASRLNDDGMIYVEGTNVSIDGNSLTYILTAMETSISNVTDLSQYGIKDITYYYAIGDSDTVPPSEPSDNSAVVGIAIVGLAIVGMSQSTTGWTTDILQAGEDEYLWRAMRVTYADGTVEWKNVECITDGYLRSVTSVLQTSLEVMQGYIESKVWMTDIYDYVDPVIGDVYVLQDQYSYIIETMDGITSEVGDITYILYGDESYEGIIKQVTTVQQTLDGLTIDVQHVTDEIGTITDEVTGLTEQYTYITEQYASLYVLYDSIRSEVNDLSVTIEGDFTELSERVATVEQTADGINTTIAAIENTVTDNYEDLSSKILSISETADGIAIQISDLSTKVGDDYTELSDRIASIILSVDGLSMRFETLEETLDGGVLDITRYFAVGDSNTEPPSEPSDNSAVVGIAVVGLAIVGLSQSTTGWTTERQEAGDGEYLWTAEKVTYQDGTVEWKTPVCLTDGYVRSELKTYGASLEVLQDKIEGRVWMDDIIDYTDEWGNTIEEQTEQAYSDFKQTVTEITGTVADLTTTVTENYTTVNNALAVLQVLVDSISLQVSDNYAYFEGGYEYLNDTMSQIQIDLDGIMLDVSENYVLNTDYSQMVAELQASIQVNADSITSEVTRATSAEPKWGSCSTAAATAAKVVTCSSFTSLVTGVVICVFFTYANTASAPTMNVNGTGAKTIIQRNYTTQSADYWWTERAQVMFIYDGTYWRFVDSGAYSKIVQTADSLTSTIASTESSLSSQITQLASSISLSVSSSSSSAAIVLSVDGSTNSTISARTAFARETGSISLTAGTITLSAGSAIIVDTGTFISNADNFSVTSGGAVSITGTLTTVNDKYKTVMQSGGLNFYYNSTSYGGIVAEYWAQNENKRGVAINMHYDGDYIAFGKRQTSTTTVSTWDYLIDYTLNYSSTTVRNKFFNGIACFTGADRYGTIYADAGFYAANGYGLRGYKTNGNYYNMVFMGTDNYIGLGDQTYNTTAYVYGYYLYLYSYYGTYSNYTIQTTSDVRLKHDIYDLTDQYDTMFRLLRPVEFAYNQGDGSRHLGFIAQDVISAMDAAGLRYDEYDVVTDYQDRDTGVTYYGLGYSELIGLTVYELQKTMQVVDDHDERIRELEQEVAELQAQLAEYQTIGG